MIGAQPRTDWIRDALALDHHGFILTGQDLPQARCPLTRAPLPFETSLPGVLAAGDVRGHGRLDVSDPSGWDAAAWASDAVPHLTFGAVTYGSLAAISRQG